MEDDLFSWQIENRERRIFLYPDAPGPRMAPADAIARCLLRECEKDGLVSADSADLSGYLVMLPGRQARHAVSQALSSLKKIIFPPEFTTSGRFRDMGCPTSLQPALPVEQKVLWINLLRDIDPLQFPALFPSGLETDLNSLFHQADLLLHLRQELNANADVNTFGSAANRLDGTDPRWAELKT